MVVCGLKLTHDSSITVADNGKLLLSIDLEKVDNNNRFKIMDDMADVEVLLNKYNIRLSDIDSFVVDGWVGEEQATIKTTNLGQPVTLAAAPYLGNNGWPSLLHGYRPGKMNIGDSSFSYSSYVHVAGHIFSVYATSPFARRGENAYILVWDGGMHPHLYFFDRLKGVAEPAGPLFYFGVNMYSVFCQHFGPFKINGNVIKDELSVAGKVMAYVAFGYRQPEIIADLEEVYDETICHAINSAAIPEYPYIFARHFTRKTRHKAYTDEDIIASFHFFCEEKILSGLAMAISRHGNRSGNFCFAGGAALNIKWNTAIRQKAGFNEVWVCPFPNDSGSSIGMAAAELFVAGGISHLDWNIYNGPALAAPVIYQGWRKEPFTPEQLASLLWQQNEPVIFLNGQAELGPRALGNRSILGNPCYNKMTRILNYIKIREYYRPVAPICLEEKAAEIFDPGCADPYMLFEHRVRNNWQKRIPAVNHTDHSARLQTVNREQHTVLYELLTEFEKLSGVPILCNTSANFKGSGFFPDVYSAMRWGKVNYVWSEGYLYSRDNKLCFDDWV